MSIKIGLDQLAETLADFASAYLITVSDDYRARTIAVVAVLRDGVLEVGAVGGGTRQNLASRDGVTLLWPPRESGGYTLIVDGRGQIAGDVLRVTPERAVLHRPAATDAAPKSGCKDDCGRLDA